MRGQSSKKQLSPLEKFADRCTQWVGSSASLVAHTLLFIGFFVLGWFGVPWTNLLLVLTTLVSLEAIYLAILIQISVNRNTRSLEEVEEDIDEIQEDMGEIEESLEEIQFDTIEALTENDEEESLSEAQHDLQNLEIARKILEDEGDMQNLR